MKSYNNEFKSVILKHSNCPSKIFLKAIENVLYYSLLVRIKLKTHLERSQLDFIKPHGYHMNASNAKKESSNKVNLLNDDTYRRLYATVIMSSFG